MTEHSTDIAQKVLDRAQKRAHAAEVIYSESESRSVSFQDNQLKSSNTKSVRGVGLRLIRNGRIGFSATNDLDTLDQLVEHALHSAEFGQQAKFEFPSGAPLQDVKILDPKAADLSMERAASIMREGIDCVLASYPDAHCGGGIHRAVGRTVLCNTAGLCHEESATGYGMGVDAFLVKGESFLWVGEGEDSCRLSEDILRHARKVKDWIGLCKKEVHLAEEKMPVLFTPHAVGIVLSTLDLNTNGKMVQKGASLLANRVGEKVLDERITIVDDPHVDYASGSGAMDGEGVPTQRNTLFENGVLRGFIFDLQTAGLMGKSSTGNGMRSYSSAPRPGNTNVRLAAGDTPYKDILAGIDRGLLLDQALGVGQSNVLAGEFSVNVELGFLIENGEIIGRVKDCMLAGNAFDALNNIRTISVETEWHGSTELPAICFESLSVVGRQK